MQEMLLDRVTYRIEVEIVQLVIVFTPEILGKRGIAFLLIVLLVLVQSIRHFKEIISCLLDPLLGGIGNTFQYQEAILDLSFNVGVIFTIHLHFTIVPFKFGLVILVGNI